MMASQSLWYPVEDSTSLFLNEHLKKLHPRSPSQNVQQAMGAAQMMAMMISRTFAVLLSLQTSDSTQEMLSCRPIKVHNLPVIIFYRDTISGPKLRALHPSL
jgi:hypothetical protein